jgi:hypothetical protein
MPAQVALHHTTRCRYFGYLIQTEGEEGESADLHAWAEAYTPEPARRADQRAGHAVQGRIPLRDARYALLILHDVAVS